MHHNLEGHDRLPMQRWLSVEENVVSVLQVSIYYISRLDHELESFLDERIFKLKNFSLLGLDRGSSRIMEFSIPD